jgi:hypothetical protein
VCIAHQKFRLQTRHLLYAAPSSIEPCLTPGESFSGRIVSLKLVSHETGIVSSNAASSTPSLVLGQGLTTARDDTPQDGALPLSLRSVMDIQTLSYRRMGLEAAALLNFSQPFFCFAGKKLQWWDVYIIFSSPQEKGRFRRLFSGLAKIWLAVSFCAS